jgi:hypothetical protein
LLRSAAKKPAPGPGNVNTVSPPSAGEQQKLQKASKSPGQLTIGGKAVTPGGRGAAFKTAGFGSLPLLVLLMLLAMAGAMMAAAVLALRRRYPALMTMDGPIGEPIRKLTNRKKDGISRFRR